MNRGLALLSLALIVPLSGCFGAPEVPDDAIVVRHDDGLVMSSWTEMRGNRLTLNAVIENPTGNEFDIRSGCGEPWVSEIIAPNGSLVPYVEVMEEPGCPVYWSKIMPRGHEEFLHSWDFAGHDPRSGDSWQMPGGNYTWRLQFSLRDEPVAMETVIPIVVPCSEKNPC